MREWERVLRCREHLNEVVGVVWTRELVVEGVGKDIGTRGVMGTKSVHQLAIVGLKLDLLACRRCC